jgi:acyl-coenzyme A synthetase/AMP-(fatty) acid ligase
MGNPKGVMIEYRAMINAVNANLCSLQPKQRFAITTNPAFDAWSYFAWYALCSGLIAVMYTSHLADLDTFVDL